MTTITLTKCIAIVVAIGGLTSGLLAAWYWERTTRVPADPLNGDPHATHAGVALAHESVVVDGPKNRHA